MIEASIATTYHLHETIYRHLGAQIEAGKVDLTQDPTEALKYIGRIMNCQPTAIP